MAFVVSGAFKTVEVALVTNVEGFAAQMGAQAATVKAFGDTVYAAAEKGNVAARGMGAGMLAAGLAIDAGFGVAISKAASFEEKMANVNSIMFLSQSQLKQTGDEVLNISVKYAKGADDLATGLYKVGSAGFVGNEGVTVLDASAKAATAGLSSVDTAATALTGALRAYGAGANDATHYSDIMLRTVQVGQTTFPELAQNLSQFVAISAAMKIPLEDAAGAMAAMTRQGVPAAVASTQLGRVLAGLLKPSADMTSALHGWGFESGEAAVKALGLHGVMQKIAESTGGNVEALHKLVPDIRAFRGVLELTNNGGQQYAQTLDEIQHNSGATQKSFEEQAKAFSFQMKQMEESLNRLAIEVGTVALPVLKMFAGGVKDVADLLGGMPTWMQVAVVASVGLTGVVLTLGGAFLFFAPKILAARELMAGWTASQAASIGPTIAQTEAESALSAATARVAETIAAVNAAEGSNVVELEAWVAATAAETEAQTALVAANTEAAASAGGLSLSLAGVAGALTAIIAPLAVVVEREKIHNMAEEFRIGKPHIKDTETAIRNLANATGDYNKQLDALASKARINQTSFGTDFLTTASKIVTAGTSGSLFGGDPNGDLTTRMRDIDKALSDMVSSGHVDEAKRGLDRIAEGLHVSPTELITHLGHYRDALGNATQAASDMAAVDAKAAQAEQLQAQEAANAAAETEKYKTKITDLTHAITSFASAPKALTDVAQDNKASGSSTGVNKIEQEKETRARALESAQHGVTTATYELDKAEDALNKTRTTGYALEQAKLNLELEKNSVAQEKNVLDVANAEDHLNRVRAAGGGQQYVREAEIALQEARDKGTELTLARKDSEQKLNDLPTQHAEALAAAEEAVRQAHERVKTAIDAEVDAAKKMSEPLTANATAIDKTAVSLQQFTKEVGNQDAAQQQWVKDLQTIISRGAPQQVVDQLVKMGADGANITHQFANATKSDFDAASAAMTTAAVDGSADYATKLNAGLEFARLQAGATTAQTVGDITAEYNKLPGVVQYTAEQMAQIAQQFGVAITVVPGGTATSAGSAASKGVLPPNSTISGLLGGIPFANGGVVSFAGGTSEDHVAQISKSMRLWAEPETGGEAYIPLSPAKRAQSMKILGQVADMFGVAMFDAARGPTGKPAAGGMDYLPPGNGAGRTGSMPATTSTMIAPVSSETHFNFSGDIQGVRMEDVEAYARRKRAIQNMTSGSGLVTIG